jgi:hypothetical protein
LALEAQFFAPKDSLTFTPEVRARLNELQSDAGLASDALADLHDAALEGLIARVDQIEALLGHHFALERERTAAVVHVEGIGFFVEWLLLRIGTVDEQGNAVLTSAALPAVRLIPLDEILSRVGDGVRPFQKGLKARVRRVLVLWGTRVRDSARFFLLRFFQRFPDATHSSLQEGWLRRSYHNNAPARIFGRRRQAPCFIR